MAVKKNFLVTETVWLWPGIGGWHFVTLPKKNFIEIRKNFGLGMIPIEAKIGKTSWKTSLFPHKDSESYLLCVKKSVRKIEDIFEGDRVRVKIEIL